MEVLPRTPRTHEDLRLLSSAARVRLARTTPSEDFQLALVADCDLGVRQALASNPRVAPSVQRVLVQEKYWQVRLALAESAALLPELAHLLAQETDMDVVVALVANEHVDLEPRSTGPMDLFHLDWSLRGSRYIDDALARAGSDPEAAAALRANWEGTLDELIETCTTFAPAKD